jgi:hypothetical protein
MKWMAWIVAGAAVLSLAAAPKIFADDVPATQPTDLLGQTFKSTSHGIAFRVPAGAVEQEQNDPEIICEFNHPDYDWQLRSWRLRLDRSLPISTHKDQFGLPQDGMLENSLASLRKSLPNMRILRNELINIGKTQVGMLAVRYETVNGNRRLLQQAIFLAPDTDEQLYYCVELNSPGKPTTEPDDIINPGENLAYQTFSQIADSVQLLDMTGVAEDQDNRLYRSRVLESVWSGAHYAQIRDALQPAQFQRIVKDGRDIGYSIIVEEYLDKPTDPDSALIHIGVRTHSITPDGVTSDDTTWCRSTVDMKHEVWTIQDIATGANGKNLDSFSQIGSSDEQAKVVTVRPAPGDAAVANGAPPANNKDIAEVRSLQVTTSHGMVKLSPVQLDTPAFYLPQAFSYLLPRLLPLDQPAKYMWAVFVPTAPTVAEETGHGMPGGKVMSRYVDVSPLEDIQFLGQTTQGVEVDDRLTLDGTPTHNYFSPTGQFLGSEYTARENDKMSTTQVLPTDASTLSRLWSNPDLTPPQEEILDTKAP